ncbi:MAG TPA: HD domain-containing phosphohydrolase [Thermoanaerobaculia bacterium]|nr:HD domain-containing phosphohydrolase [Thermoanaerobaculia bacterium]
MPSPSLPDRPPPGRIAPAVMALAFGLFGALWIAASDLVLGRLVEDPERLTLLQSAKGLGFVLAGAFFVYLVARSERPTAPAPDLDRLRALDHAIASSHDLPLVLGVLLDHAVAQLGADAAAILLVDRGGTLVEADARGLRRRMRRQEMGQGAAGRAAREGRLVRVADLAAVDDEAAAVAESGGLSGYAAVPLRAQRGVVGVLEIYFRGDPPVDPRWEVLAAAIASRSAIAVDAAQLFEELRRSNVELALAYEQTIEGWSRALDLRDHETEGHTQRVAELTVRLARRMGIGGEELTHLRRGALLHDIGKMGVPDRILLKPDRLTEDEWAVMRQHPLYAYRLLAPIRHLRQALDIPYCHHERWDGTGYPRGLAGEEIPRAARIFAVADVWDALTSDRPYRPAWTRDEALAYVAEGSGSLFDPRVVEVFLAMAADSKLPRPAPVEDVGAGALAGGEGS